MAFAPIIFDLIVIAVMIYYIITSYHKGFVSTLIDLAAYLVSFLAANFLGKTLSVMLYESYLSDRVYQVLLEKIQSAINPDQFIQSLQTAFENVPAVLQNILSFGDISLDKLQNIAGNTAQAVASAINDQLIAPTVILLLWLVFFMIIFSVCLFLAHRLEKLFRGLRHLPVIGGINSLLGGAAGVLHGVIAVYIIALLAKLIIMLLGNSMPLFSEEIIQNTKLFIHFYNFQLFSLLP